MADLSPEDKQRIYLEEKARLEAQDQLKTEARATTTEKRDERLATGIRITVLLLILGGLCGWLYFNYTPSYVPPEPLPPAFRIQARETRAAIERCITNSGPLPLFEAEKALDSLNALSDYRSAEYNIQLVLQNYLFRVQMYRLSGGKNPEMDEMHKAMRDVMDLNLQ